MQKYKKFIFDIVLNAVAIAVPLLALQLVILPAAAVRMSDEGYGLLLTVLSVMNVVSGSLGNALNNIRLLKDGEYEKAQVKGDFSVLLLGEAVIDLSVVFFVMLRYDMGWPHRLLVCVMAVVWLCKEYYVAVFRLNLNFKGIVWNNLVMTGGYFAGTALFWVTGYWELIYLTGILLSLLYIFCTTSIMREPLKITALIKNTGTDLLFLAVSVLLANLLNYADRIIIYPLIGAAAVSVYYVSTLFGKVVSTGIGPLSSVMLSYLAKRETLSSKLFKKVVAATAGIAVLGYIVCRIIAYPALKVIYPQWADEAIVYVPITTLIAMIVMFNSVLSPFVLKFCKMKWQLIINTLTLCIYMSASVAFYYRWGMMGFCSGVLLSNLAKLCVMIVLGFRVNDGKSTYQAESVS